MIENESKYMELNELGVEKIEINLNILPSSKFTCIFPEDY